jgi:hypothetical protein
MKFGDQVMIKRDTSTVMQFTALGDGNDLDKAFRLCRSCMPNTQLFVYSGGVLVGS